MPWLGSLITSGGRLLLGMIQKEVSNAGGRFLMTDTDSMAIVSTRGGGIVECPGGDQKLNGVEAIKALPWKQVDRITERIQTLSPYMASIRLLKVDKVNRNRAGKQHQLFGIGYSAKRYCLCTDKEVIKPSEHGLGPYFVPAYDGDDRFWKPKNSLKNDEYLRWVKELWDVKLGFRRTLPKWANYFSMRKYAVTSPHVLTRLRDLDRDAAKPYSFCISPVPSFGNNSKIAPYCDEPNRWEGMEYVSLGIGTRTRLSSLDKERDMKYSRKRIVADDHDEKLMNDIPHKLSRVIEDYSASIEHKSLAPDGSKCDSDTKGLLRPRAIEASGVFHLLGKEIDRGTSVDPEYLSDEKLAMYGKTDKPRLAPKRRHRTHMADLNTSYFLTFGEPWKNMYSIPQTSLNIWIILSAWQKRRAKIS